jgi:hypothetical protein
MVRPAVCFVLTDALAQVWRFFPFPEAVDDKPSPNEEKFDENGV